MRLLIASLIILIASPYCVAQSPKSKEDIRSATIIAYHRKFDTRTQVAINSAKSRHADTTRAERFCLNPWTLQDIRSCTDELAKLGVTPAQDRIQWQAPK